ncbi:ABC transporter substrate-binding protein [Bacillus dakarensis]|uniref:ABC transporter substrate-binding protein n=1 Tax=Robertmurraya dakarensis TaxID=1926278 RepID=UPI0009823C0A|nr:ABC transporter substrate-binding protein [Bacillus dakarensis]
MKQYKKFVMIFIAAIFVITGCSGQQSTSSSDQKSSEEKENNNNTDTEKTLYFAIGGEVKDFDPHFLAGLPEYAVVPNLFNGLVRMPLGKVDVTAIEGDLAEKWESNETSTQWTFYLRQGVQWHKGYGELTAEDVKSSYERVIDPTNGISDSTYFQHVESIETPDQYTVVFNLSNPDPNFLQLLMNYKGGAIANTKAIDAGEPHIGTGPFEYAEYKTQDQAILVKNKDYFRGEPKIDKVIFKIMTDSTAIDVAMEKGEIHMSLGISDPLWLDKISKNQDLKVELGGPNNQGNFYLNSSKEPLNDIRVRQAIAHAIDAESYVTSMTTNGKVPQGPIPSDVSGAVDAGKYEYNIEKAKQLLKEAGYENGFKLPPQYVSQASHILNPMVFAQDQLKQIGIDMPLEKVEHTTYQDNMRKDMNTIAYVAFNRIPHASWWVRDVYHSNSTVGTPTGVLNYSHYDKSDALIDQAVVATDESEANELYAQIQKQVMEEYVVAPLIEYSTTLVRRTEVDLGYSQHGGSLYYYWPLNENTDLK